MTELSRIRRREVLEAQQELRARTELGVRVQADLGSRNWCATARAVGWAAGALALVALVSVSARAQQSPSGTLKSSVTYTDQSSDDCEKQNADNPYAGMNPLVCYGEEAPTDSQGQCTLGGWQVLKKEGNTCYYCAPINSPIVGIIIPMDQVWNASLQGWGCGLDQADACMVICRGGNTYSPLPGSAVKGGGPGLPPTPAPIQGGPPPGYAPMPGPAGGIGYEGGANPCLPKGPGGYDYCQNGPGARLPAGCVCPGTTLKASTSSQYSPCQPAQPDMPAAAPYVRYAFGFEKGFGGCAVSQSVAGNVAAGAFGNAYSVVPSMLNISASPQTIQSVMHPAGASTNPDPYLEGQVDGNRLCGWLLANESGKISACPGAQQPVPKTQPPLTANETVECAPLSKDGFIFCAGGSGTQQATCDCNDHVTLSTSTSAAARCDDLLQKVKTLPKWTPTQIKILELDAANARDMLTRAKKHLDNNTDIFTPYTMAIYFNSTSQDVKDQLSVVIDAELGLLGNIGLVEQHIYPDLYAGQKNSPIPSWASAYAKPSETKAEYPMFFLCNGYWKGTSELRARIIVHELSHLNAAGGAVDLTYDIENCLTLAHYSGPIQSVSRASQGLQGKNFGTGTGQLPTAYMKAVNTKTPEQWSLVPITTPTNAALINADSISLFVQQLACISHKRVSNCVEGI